MAEIHRLPEMDAAEREASEWIARLNADAVSAEDLAAFELWRRAHPRHARAYEELAATWGHFMDAGRVARTVAFGQAINSVADDALNTAGVQTTGRSLQLPKRTSSASLAAKPETKPKKHGLIQNMPLAAGLAALTVFAFWSVQTHRPQTAFKTTIGEHASIALPDGSSLDLNSNSRANVEYSADARVIRLTQGEAYFKVAHDKSRPFWVVAGDSWVRAVGTAFNVYMRHDGVRVTVSEGVVKVAAGEVTRGAPSDTALAKAAAAVVNAGQQAELRGNAARTRSLANTEIARSIAWRGGILYFENQPLGEVVDEMRRYTPLDIFLEDKQLRDLPVGGAFQAGPQGADALLTMLRDGFKLDIRYVGNRAYISFATVPQERVR